MCKCYHFGSEVLQTKGCAGHCFLFYTMTRLHMMPWNSGIVAVLLAVIIFLYANIQICEEFILTSTSLEEICDLYE